MEPMDEVRPLGRPDTPRKYENPTTPARKYENPTTPPPKNPDIANLKGVRAAFSSESDKQRRFSKLWFVANHPRATYDESRGFWRRIKLIPFHRSFYWDYEADYNPSNPLHALVDVKLEGELENELSGILNWALEGVERQAEDFPALPMVTKQAGAAYDAASTCPRWLQFLEEIFVDPETGEPDRELIRFVQRAVGYTLTGRTQEHAMFLMHGGGANGKTVFINILMRLMGALPETPSC